MSLCIIIVCWDMNDCNAFTTFCEPSAKEKARFVFRCCGLPSSLAFAQAHPVAFSQELDREGLELARYWRAFAVALLIALRVESLEVAWVAGQVHD